MQPHNFKTLKNLAALCQLKITLFPINDASTQARTIQKARRARLINTICHGM